MDSNLLTIRLFIMPALEFPTKDAFPRPGVEGQEYLAKDTNITWIWVCVNGNCDYCRQTIDPTSCNDAPIYKSLAEACADGDFDRDSDQCKCAAELNGANPCDGGAGTGCTTDYSGGVHSIVVELKMGFSNLFRTKACPDDDPCDKVPPLSFVDCYSQFPKSNDENDPQNASNRQNCINRELRNSAIDKLTLVIDGYAKEQAVNEVDFSEKVCNESIPGETINNNGKTVSSQFKFPIKIKLDKIKDFVLGILETGTLPNNQPIVKQCDIAEYFQRNAIQIQKIEFPIYLSCTPTTGNNSRLIENVRRACNGIGRFAKNEQIISEDNMKLDCAGSGRFPSGEAMVPGLQQACQNCAQAIQALENTACYKAGTISRRSTGIANRPFHETIAYHIRCPNEQYKKLCGVMECLKGNSTIDTRPSADNVVTLQVDATIENSTGPVETNECYRSLNPQIKVTKNFNEITFTIVIGDLACAADETENTKNKYKYAVIRRKRNLTTGQFSDDCAGNPTSLCECVEATYDEDFQTFEILNSNESWPGASPSYVNEIVTNAQGKQVVRESGYYTPAGCDTGEWSTNQESSACDYEYKFFRCKKCSDEVIQSAMDQWCSENQTGYCCIHYNNDPTTTSLDYNVQFYKSSRQRCCDEIKRVIRLYPDAAGNFLGQYGQGEEANAKKRCMPNVNCCLPGPYDGGMCVYKARNKPKISFELEMDIKTCSIEPNANRCEGDNTLAPNRRLGRCYKFKSGFPSLGICSHKSNIADSQNNPNDILLPNGDFNYTKLLGSTGISNQSNLRFDLEKYRICTGVGASNYAFCNGYDAASEKTRLVEAISRLFGNGSGQFFLTTTRSECAQLADAGNWTTCPFSTGSNYYWEELPQVGEETANNTNRSSCNDLKQGPKTQTISNKITIDNFCWDFSKPLNEANLREYILSDKFKSSIYYTNLRNNLIRAIDKLIDFVPAKCSSGSLSETFACMTADCCEQFIRRTLKAAGLPDSEIENRVGFMTFTRSIGTFLCENKAAESRNLLQPEEPIPNNTNSLYPVPFNYQDPNQVGVNVSDIVDYLLDQSDFRLTNIDLDTSSCNESWRGTKSFYVAPIAPADSSDAEKTECRNKVIEYNKCCDTTNVVEGKDYIFVPGFTQVSQLGNITISDDGTISTQYGGDPNSRPGGCTIRTPKQDATAGIFYQSPEFQCQKSNGRVVDDCESCTPDTTTPMPTPDTPPPSPDPNDPNDPNDPGNPPPTQPGGTCASVEYAYQDNTTAAEIVAQFTIKLPKRIVSSDGSIDTTVNSIVDLSNIAWSGITGKESVIKLDPTPRPGRQLAAARLISVKGTPCP